MNQDSIMGVSGPFVPKLAPVVNLHRVGVRFLVALIGRLVGSCFWR
jgi:hypothetical protein